MGVIFRGLAQMACNVCDLNFVVNSAVPFEVDQRLVFNAWFVTSFGIKFVVSKKS